MRLVVTRPAPEAGRWVERLRAAGHDAFALPLLAIGPAPDPAAVRRAWDGLARLAAVMFVSANAVAGFFSAAPARPWPAGGPRAWAPGPGTREALRAAGVPAVLIDSPPATAAQFDSEALWPVVAGRLARGDRVLLVRGADGRGAGRGREWLSEQLRAAGAQVETIAAYTRTAPAWDAAQRAQARAAAAGDALWIFSSSQALAHLQQLLPGQDWRGARALATHPRIAAAARALGFGEVRESRPALEDMVASIESPR